MLAIGRSLLIISDVTFKMAAWRPYCLFFGFKTLTLLWLWISTSNFRGTILMYMARSLLIFSNVILQNGRLAAILDFSFLDSVGGMVFRSVSQICFGISISNFICVLMVVKGRSLLTLSDVPFKMAAWWPFWNFGFQTLTLVWLWISTPNLSGTILMYMCRRLLIFSNVNFKMAARRPCWIFLVSGL